MENKFRGNHIYEKEGDWYFVDSDIPCIEYEKVPCGICKELLTPEGHDPCLGTLPGVMNACCGHGETKEAYVQYWDGSVHRREKATFAISLLKKIRDGQ